MWRRRRSENVIAEGTCLGGSTIITPVMAAIAITFTTIPYRRCGTRSRWNWLIILPFGACIAFKIVPVRR